MFALLIALLHWFPAPIEAETSKTIATFFAVNVFVDSINGSATENASKRMIKSCIMNNRSFRRFLKKEALALEPFCLNKNIIDGIVISFGFGRIKYRIMNGTRAKRAHNPIIELIQTTIYIVPLFLFK